MTILIRKAEERDTNSIKNLMLEYIVDFYKKPKPDVASLELLIQNLLTKPYFGTQFIAENDQGEILGFATLYYSFSTLSMKRAAILNDLYVSPLARGEKMGEKLFSKCLDYIRKQDFAYMTWETAKDNEIAQALYKKMGGEESEWVTYYIH